MFPKPLLENSKCEVFRKQKLTELSCKWNSLLNEGFFTWPHFESENFGNSEMAYFVSQSALKQKTNCDLLTRISLPLVLAWKSVWFVQLSRILIGRGNSFHWAIVK